MAVTVKSSGPRGAKTYEIRWKNGELYDYTDTAAAAKRAAAAARKAERAYYGTGRRSNPTKAQKRANASRTRRKSGIAKAVKTLLKKANPSAKISGARVVRLKGGALRITPIKANPAGRWTVDAWHGGGGVFHTRKAAAEHAKRLREANRQAGNVGPVKVKKLA